MFCQDGEALEAGTKKFEDLEFQQLERESSLEEERETISQQLLQEKAEYHRSVAKRKVRTADIKLHAAVLSADAEGRVPLLLLGEGVRSGEAGQPARPAGFPGV